MSTLRKHVEVEGGKSRLTLAGKYDAPFGPVRAIFDQTAASTSPASSPKE